MHEGEYEINVDVVRRLLVSQFPHWSDLKLQPIASTGTDNALFRLGNTMVVRMPIVDWAVADVEKEQKWLPYLAPCLPVPIPTPLALGSAGDGYPCNWSIYRWCDGENPQVGNVEKPLELAADLANFLTCLQRIDTTGAFKAERGLSLRERDEPTRAAIDSLESRMDTREIRAMWESFVDLPVWQGPDLWLHGDLSAGNILTRDGRLSAVIDFGAMGVGDPAVDLIVAWNLLPEMARVRFRSQVGVDQSTWLRGRAWALSIALVQLPYYAETNAALAHNARYVIGEVLASLRAEQC